METQVTKRIEEAVNTISGIDELRSISAEGVSLVIIQFMLEKDPDVAAQEVRDKVSAILRRAAARRRSAGGGETRHGRVAGHQHRGLVAGRDLRETTKLVDDRIKKNIESLSGVGQVRFVGDRTRQIQVWLDGNKLYAYNLNIDQVRAALAAQNVESPGRARRPGPPRAHRCAPSAASRGPRISTASSSPTWAARPCASAISDRWWMASKSRVRWPAWTARPAVVLEVRKQAGTNTLDVINAVKERVDGAEQEPAARFQGHLHARSVELHRRDRSTPCRST